MEIERKFLVKDISKLNLDKYKRKIIIQDYLYTDKFTAIRKRYIEQDNNKIYKYTVKTNKTKYAVNEIEKDITEEQYNELEVNPKNHTIEKVRYLIPYIEGLIIELDVFLGDYKGIVFAEIEFKSEEQANYIELPEWFGRELSNEVTNSMMATMNVEIIKNKLNG